MKTSTAVIALLGALSLPAIFPILKAGFFPMHDDTQVARVAQMHQALGNGQFPVRWVPDLGYGYGYPIFNFYNPLPYYFAAATMYLEFDALAATKLMFIFPIILSSLTMFLFARLVLPRWGSVVASMLYLYSPYHATQIYVRGAVAEYWAYALLPLVIWSLWRGRVIIGAFILAALTLSHNLTAFMSIPLLIFLIPISPQNKSKTWRALAIQFILALGLSAFFWLPATLEASKTRLSQMVFSEFDPPAAHAVRWRQLWWSPWGFGGSSPGIDDGFSMQLGKVHILGSVLAIALWLHGYIVNKRKFQDDNHETMKPYSRIVTFLIIGLLFSLFMLLPRSSSIWNSLPLLSYIQFPWRYLIFASLFSSLLAALAIYRLLDVSKNFISTTRYLPAYLSIIVSIVIIVASIKFFQPQFTYPTTAQKLTARDNLIWDISGRSDEYLPLGFVRPVTLEEARRVDNPQNTALVNQLKVKTPIRQAGNLISLFSLLVLVALLSKKFLKERRIQVLR